MKKTLVLLLSILICYNVFASSTNTFQLTLAWNPSTDVNVIGYNIYYGTLSKTYTNKSDALNVTNYTLNLPKIAGVTYYFAATSYNILGLESDYTTNEPTYTVPTTNGLTSPIIHIVMP